MRLSNLSATGLLARIEFPTLVLLLLTYSAWVVFTIYANTLGLWLTIPLLAVVLAQHSSLQHEIIHGHPFHNQKWNDALVFPALGLWVPYEQFRTLHLAHHHDPLLTDPYDDPESNYLDPAVWSRLSRPARAVLAANNTLLGRMVIGPLLGTVWLWHDDFIAIRRGDRRVTRAYLLHLIGVAPVVIWLLCIGTMPVWAYFLSCWLALSVLRIRTFLEHRAHEKHGARSVIIEDRGPLALLFLNNNFHAVHHAHPNLPWYRLPEVYARRRDEFLRRNHGYVYRSYAQVFSEYFLRRKDPVAHPIWTPTEPR